MENGFIASDFKMTVQELANLTDEQRKWANIPCEYAEEWAFWVRSEGKKDEWYKVQHDDENIIKCSCMWARTHKGFCRKHFFRAALALRKRNARQAQKVTAPVVVEKPKEQPDRLGNYLTRAPGFNFYR